MLELKRKLIRRLIYNEDPKMNARLEHSKRGSYYESGAGSENTVYKHKCYKALPRIVVSSSRQNRDIHVGKVKKEIRGDV